MKHLVAIGSLVLVASWHTATIASLSHLKGTPFGSLMRKKRRTRTEPKGTVKSSAVVSKTTRSTLVVTIFGEAPFTRRSK